MKSIKKALCVLLLLASACASYAAGAGSFVAKTGIQKFPAISSLYDKLDLSDPYKTVVSGLFRQDLNLKTETRSFLVYVAPNNHQSESYVCIIPDSRQDPRQALELNGWKEIADANGLVLVIMEPKSGGWDIEKDMTYLSTMYSQSRLRQWYNVQKGNSYLVGYGDGATLAQAWAMRTPANFASVATFGPVSLSVDFIASAAAAKTESPLVRNNEIPLPMWMFVESCGVPERRVFEYWKTANQADGTQVFRNDDVSELYLAKPNALSTFVDEVDMIAQTRLSVAPNALADDAERTKKVWGFLSSVTRTGGIINSDLRPAYTLQDWKATKQTIQIDGVTRQWFEFVPAQLHNAVNGKVPLVVAMHGSSTTADAFLWRSEWIKLANERGFIVVFPAASFNKDDKAMPRPNWNIAEDKTNFDDYKFLRGMIADVSKRLPADPSRVYATGQSMGFMTSLAIALRLDDLVTAIAGETGFLLTDKAGAPYYTSEYAKHTGKIPVFVIIGQNDMPDFLSEPTKKINLEYWIRRDAAGEYEAPFGSYVDGRYRITSWADRNNIPLVQYAFELERPHAPVPSDNTMLYDGFLSKWSRGSDGTLYYMGKAIQ